MQLQRTFPQKAGNASSGTGGGSIPGSASGIFHAYTAAPGATVTTNLVTVTPVGTPAYAYVWTIDNPNVTITASTSAATRLTATGTGPASSYIGSARCTYTDSVGLVGYVDVEYTIQIGGSSL